MNSPHDDQQENKVNPLYFLIATIIVIILTVITVYLLGWI